MCVGQGMCMCMCAGPDHLSRQGMCMCMCAGQYVYVHVCRARSPFLPRYVYVHVCRARSPFQICRSAEVRILDSQYTGFTAPYRGKQEARRHHVYSMPALRGRAQRAPHSSICYEKTFVILLSMNNPSSSSALQFITAPNTTQAEAHPAANNSSRTLINTHPVALAGTTSFPRSQNRLPHVLHNK
jgi:hypothetical protein